MTTNDDLLAIRNRAQERRIREAETKEMNERLRRGERVETTIGGAVSSCYTAEEDLATLVEVVTSLRTQLAAALVGPDEYKAAYEQACHELVQAKGELEVSRRVIKLLREYYANTPRVDLKIVAALNELDKAPK